MPAHFFDTSAVAKRYDTRESGSARVQSLCQPEPGRVLVLAAITSPEFASTLGRKLRRDEIDQQDLERLWLEFVGHRETAYSFVELDPPIYRQAERILLARDLRSFDAIQIACALRARPLFATVDPEFLFVTADRRQANAAQAEGLTVELVV